MCDDAIAHMNMRELLLGNNRHPHRTNIHHAPEHDRGTQADPCLETPGRFKLGHPAHRLYSHAAAQPSRPEADWSDRF